MKLDLDLTQAGYKVESLKTRSAITLQDGKISLSVLRLKANVPGFSNEEIQRIAENAERTCPVSGAFNFPIRLEASLA